MQRAFFDCLRSTPVPFQKAFNRVWFWPTVLATRALASVCPSCLRLRDEVAPGIWLGVAPVFLSDVYSLHKDGIRCVVNTCEEWREHEDLYKEKGIREVYLPTLDHHPPTTEECNQASGIMKETLDAGDKVYVHCKAGRGRSTTVVLYHLVQMSGERPEAVQAAIKKHRGHVVNKWKSEPIQDLWHAMGHEDDGSIAAAAVESTTGSERNSSELPPTRLQQRARKGE